MGRSDDEDKGAEVFEVPLKSHNEIKAIGLIFVSERE